MLVNFLHQIFVPFQELDETDDRRHAHYQDDETRNQLHSITPIPIRTDTMHQTGMTSPIHPNNCTEMMATPMTGAKRNPNPTQFFAVSLFTFDPSIASIPQT